ncbi:Rpp14/Pop5 family-domain-containing protein [Russula earlei]|uniref:Rpp14/Pop5 family-domain-containing protein n=1 Tax=Russula earlei TaxID=71964 RepID=A0ACC0TZG4_9AGAM|nr:Rpp14/Pop5 family-domain-containing protein [Russula earlei]
MVRFKNRWLLVEFIPIVSSASDRAIATTQSQEEISGKDVFNALKQSVLLHFGDIGWGEVGASLAVKYFSPATNLCILRVARGPATSTAWAALVLLDRVRAGDGEGRKVVPHVIHVSGTLKHAQIAAAGVGVCGPSGCPHFFVVVVLTASTGIACRCSGPTREVNRAL